MTLVLALPACSGSNALGPRHVRKDRVHYRDGLSMSNKQQILMNMVKARYMEAPFFVNISSIIDQYSVGGSADGRLGFGDALRGANTQGLSASTRWENRPTITYAPLKGQEFARNLLTPLTPESLFALVQSGWSTSVLMGLTVSSINGIQNASGGTNPKDAEPQFWELLDVWSRLRAAGALALRADATDGKRNLVVFSRDLPADTPVGKDLARLREILGLSASGTYKIEYGLVPKGPDEIALLTRSALEILLTSASYFDVPEIHLRQGRAAPRVAPPSDTRAPVIRVRHSCDRPPCAYVAVFNRGHWFWIDDSDVRSKRAFAFIEVLLNITDTGATGHGPVVSIGN